MAGTTLGGRSITTVYSNIGRIQMPPEYETYIERFGFFTSTDKVQMCSVPTVTAWCLESHLKSLIPILNGT